MKRLAIFACVACLLLLGTSAEGSRRRGGGSRAAAGWSQTDPPVNETHIFEGGINGRGSPVGFHSRPGGHDPTRARVVRVLRPPNRNGVYEAEVEVQAPDSGRWLAKRSTFYPDRLDRPAVIAAILHAYAGRSGTSGRDAELFRGPSGLGFTIEGYLLRDGRINTAYPIY